MANFMSGYSLEIIEGRNKERREEIGIKLEEAAGDLEITVAQLENLEDGNINAFKDIFFLKELIKKYATYLNVNEEELMEDFNDFVFDYTSKIPVEEIEQKVKEIEKLEEKWDIFFCEHVDIMPIF